jgi:hypothetical protein
MKMILALVIAAVSLVPPRAAGQAKPAATKVWRTPWGDPDLQGSWSNATTTPLQRPAKYEGREFLTAEERREQDKETAIGTDKRGAPGSDQDVNDAYNAFWWERGWSDGRTSLIYDPPNGRIPPLTAQGQKRLAELNAINRSNEGFGGRESYNGPEDLSLYTRCVIRAPLPRVPTGYDINYEIVQGPGYVAIVQEQMHETRVIPLDARPHLSSSVRQWLGDSRAHWEGNTLVVETKISAARFHSKDQLRTCASSNAGHALPMTGSITGSRSATPRRGPNPGLPQSRGTRPARCMNTRATKTTTPCTASSPARAPRRKKSKAGRLSVSAQPTRYGPAGDPPEVPIKITPDRMHMVPIVRRYHVHEERRTLNPIIMFLTAFRFSGPCKRDLFDSRLLQLCHPVGGNVVRHLRGIDADHFHQ